jgi:transcriptional regulator with XRE-family HTH domain
VTRRPTDDESVPADLQRIFGENLRRARTEAGLSQRALSALTGIPQPIIVAVEAGRQNLTIVSMSKLASAVGKEVPVMLTPAAVDSPKKKTRKSPKEK